MHALIAEIGVTHLMKYHHWLAFGVGVLVGWLIFPSVVGFVQSRFA